jgi:cytochrome c556
MRFQVKLLVLAALVAGVAYLGTATAQEEKIKDVKGCMAFQNKVRGDLGKQVKSKSPDWEAIQKETKEWVGVAETLGKQSPPKGTAESWKKQTETYMKNVKAVDEAAEKKDSAAATKALATVGASCGGCHAQHKPKK